MVSLVSPHQKYVFSMHTRGYNVPFIRIRIHEVTTLLSHSLISIEGCQQQQTDNVAQQQAVRMVLERCLDRWHLLDVPMAIR